MIGRARILRSEKGRRGQWMGGGGLSKNLDVAMQGPVAIFSSPLFVSLSFLEFMYCRKSHEL